MTLTQKQTAILQHKLSEVIRAQQSEGPMQVFNKMCFGFVSNNWIVVIASILKLTTFMLILALPKSV
jgi:hypothetical protein